MMPVLLRRWCASWTPRPTSRRTPSLQSVAQFRLSVKAPLRRSDRQGGARGRPDCRCSQGSLRANAPLKSEMAGKPIDVRNRKFALVSVSDKAGLPDLAQGLMELGYDLTSTGGSAAAIAKQDLPVTPVEDLTHFPEMLDGRVKTLHPTIHGGILAKRDDPSHMEILAAQGIPSIDVVVVNLYPFRQTVLSDPPPSFPLAMEKIDIGGPALIRAAAKNHAHVSVAVDPEDYEELLEMLASQAGESDQLQFRRRLAWKAFQHCAAYDAAVSEWMWHQTGILGVPPALTLPLQKAQDLRYGENPHQSAAFYLDQSLEKAGIGGIASAIQHHGKEMSYNNYLDADGAYGCVCDMEGPSCIIVKHTNPCGGATREDLCEAYRLALEGDPLSAFGGIVAFNRQVDAKVAQEIRDSRNPLDPEKKMFYEIVIAPSYTAEGLEILKRKSKNLRILEAAVKTTSVGCFRQVSGAFLFQGEDDLKPGDICFSCVSKTQLDGALLEDVRFAWTCVKHVKSNAIVIAKNGRLLGMGSGQPNRVKSVELSLEKAASEAKGAVLASEAFFPFAWGDAVERACQAGVAAIVQPGGSVADQDCIDCCDQYGVALVMTAVRHFRH